MVIDARDAEALPLGLTDVALVELLRGEREGPRRGMRGCED